VTRVLGLLLAVISLAVTGVLMLSQGAKQGPTSAAAARAESQAIATGAAAVFSPVDQLLQVDLSQTGTYVGAELPVGSGVTLAQATATSYCLEADLSGTVVHENGPGGSPAVGHC
jgi:histidine ammonia-lyase